MIDWTSVTQDILGELGWTRPTFVELRWVSSAEIQQLNRDHRTIDQPTDVLSFPLFSYQELETYRQRQQQDEPPLLLGSLVLCRAEIEKHARLQERSIDEQIHWSLQHGLRHLLGYDHDERGEIWLPVTKDS